MSAFAYSQTEQVINTSVETILLTDEHTKTRHSFGVVQNALDDQVIYGIAGVTIDAKLTTNFILYKNPTENEEVFAFVPESGLYSGFGTAWHRNSPSHYQSGNVLNTEVFETARRNSNTHINLNSTLFRASLSIQDDIDMPLSRPFFQSQIKTFSKPLVNITVGYRNSF